jgi:hypothetical protein
MNELKLKQLFPNLEYFVDKLGLDDDLYKKQWVKKRYLTSIKESLEPGEEVLFMFVCRLSLYTKLTHIDALSAVTSNNSIYFALKLKDGSKDNIDKLRINVTDINKYHYYYISVKDNQSVKSLNHAGSQIKFQRIWNILFSRYLQGDTSYKLYYPYELEIRQVFPSLEIFIDDSVLYDLIFNQWNFDSLKQVLETALSSNEKPLFLFGCKLINSGNNYDPKSYPIISEDPKHKWGVFVVTSYYMFIFIPVKEGIYYDETLRAKISDIVNIESSIGGIFPETAHANLILANNSYYHFKNIIKTDTFDKSVVLLKDYIQIASDFYGDLKNTKRVNDLYNQMNDFISDGFYPVIDIIEPTEELLLQNRIEVAANYENLVSSRKSRLRSNDFDPNNIPFPDIIQYYTIIETDKILIENGLIEYSINEVSRSSHPSIGIGEYFYCFDDAGDLLMYKVPYRHVSTRKGNYIFLDSELYNKNEVIVIPKSEIISFKLYGTELMQSTVRTNSLSRDTEQRVFTSQSGYQPPSIVGTALSAILFGSTYTILKGVGKSIHQQTNVLGNRLNNLEGKMDDIVDAINSISISTDHQIIDTSRVQIVLSERRDLEIDGVNIYYDLNRVYPEKVNKSFSATTQIESQETGSQISMTDEIMKLKKMLDDGIIDEEEFKSIKKKLIREG